MPAQPSKKTKPAKVKPAKANVVPIRKAGKKGKAR